jgi:hypothetical protein
MPIDDLKPGQRVRVTQTIERRERDWTTCVTGTVQSISLGTTGSWYAHSQDNKYWLRRLQLVKDDGEVTTLNVDPYTVIETL